MSRAKARAALMQELENALRRSSAQGVIFGQTVANTVGISGSDLECLDFLNLEGRVTAGRLAEVVDLKFFCGFTFAEIASMRGVTERTVQRDWEKARIYLHHALRSESAL